MGKRRIQYTYDTGDSKTATAATSKGKFRIDGKYYHIFLNFTESYFELIDKNNEVVYRGGGSKSNNRRVLMNQAKKFLHEVGVKFKLEVRGL